jgi:hypothetical protein
MGIAMIFGLSACSKNDDAPKEKQNITANAVSFELRTLSTNARGIAGKFIDANGAAKYIDVNISPDVSLKNGTATITNTDIVADDSGIISSGNASAAAITNPTNPNSFKFTFDDNPNYASITLNIVPSSIFYLNGKDAYTTYTLRQIDSASKAVAIQVAGLHSQLQVR